MQREGATVKARMIGTVIVAALSVAVSGGVAEAASGPIGLQRDAQAQTELLFDHYFGPPQNASPVACDEGHGAKGSLGEFLLPTLSFGSGDASFTCHIRTHRVVLDLGGAIATEDKRGDTYTTAGGQVLLFTRANLQAICDDVLRFYPSGAPATVDNNPVTGSQLSTTVFSVDANHGASPYYQDSVDLGHPGRVAACFAGWKAEIPLTRGHHLIQVDLSAAAGAPTHFRYDITVADSDR